MVGAMPGKGPPVLLIKPKVNGALHTRLGGESSTK